MPVTPAEGYRLSRFRDAETQICLPVLGASVSAEKLFDVFVTRADFHANGLASGLPREIETALFIENREGRVDAELEAVLPNENAAKAVNGGDRRRR